MPELQNRIVEILARSRQLETRARWPSWLQRPGRDECGPLWETCCLIYSTLTGGMKLPDSMPPRESRSVDGLLKDSAGRWRLLEFDESQHFNRFRAQTLQLYPPSTLVGYPIQSWVDACCKRNSLPGGGLARPCPPLFPKEGGRHLQRAFRDTLADLLPAVHGFGPTIRLADFEVGHLIDASDAERRLNALMDKRLSLAG